MFPKHEEIIENIIIPSLAILGGLIVRMRIDSDGYRAVTENQFLTITVKLYLQPRQWVIAMLIFLFTSF